MAMSNKVDMNVFLHSLLITKQMNNFTVTETKEALLHEHAKFTDDKKTRMFIYRQLSRNIKKGLIKRTDHFDRATKQIIYSKTKMFFASSITPVKRETKSQKSIQVILPVTEPKIINYEAALKNELIAYEIDLKTTLEEAKEYKRLSARFPELEEKVQQYQSEAKNRSIKILGKVHALQTLLGYSVTEYPLC